MIYGRSSATWKLGVSNQPIINFASKCLLTFWMYMHWAIHSGKIAYSENGTHSGGGGKSESLGLE